MAEATYTPRLRTFYDEVVRPKMIEEFGYKNAMEVPVIEKIVINMGVGEATADTKKATTAAADLGKIAGQKPVLTRARQAISNFKLRENQPVGAKVTLRKMRRDGLPLPYTEPERKRPAAARTAALPRRRSGSGHGAGPEFPVRLAPVEGLIKDLFEDYTI